MTPKLPNAFEAELTKLVYCSRNILSPRQQKALQYCLTKFDSSYDHKTKFSIIKALELNEQ